MSKATPTLGPLLAHRGAGFLDTENTLEALELGWSMGLETEIDVSTTRDGVIIGFHDGDFSRMLNDPPASLRNRKLADTDWNELRALNIGTPDKPRRIPTIAEALTRLHAHPDRRLYLDIKCVDFPSLAALVRKHDVAAQVIFSTNNNAWITAWRALMPGTDTLRWVWMDEGQAGWTKAEAEIAILRAQGFAGITQLQLHILVGETLHPSEPVIRALVDELRARNIVFQIFPHSNDPNIYRRLHQLGVHSFATDHPHELLDALRSEN